MAQSPGRSQPVLSPKHCEARGSQLLLPLLVVDAAWTARNWPYYHHLVPLKSTTWSGYKNPPDLQELNSLMGAIGE